MKSEDKGNPYFLIGKIVKAHGLRGAVKIHSFSDFPERFLELEEVYLSPSSEPLSLKKYLVDQISEMSPNHFLCYFKSIKYRDQSEALVKSHLFLPDSEAYELPEDMFYISDLLKYQVLAEDGTILGQVTNVIQNQQDLIEFTNPEGKTHMVPFVKQFVPEIDSEKCTLTLRLVDGLLDL